MIILIENIWKIILICLAYDGIVYDGILELILSKAKLGGAYLY